MSALAHILRPDFVLHHAVYGSLIVGLVCPLVGVHIVARRLVFWGVALPQVSTAGIAFAFLLQGFGVSFLAGEHGHDKHLAMAGSVLFTGATVLILAWRERRARGASEGPIGALYALAAALSILFVAWNAAGETEILGLLRGELVSISDADFRGMLAFFAATAAALVLFQREFTLVSFDRDFAVALGRRAAAWDLLLFGIIALIISLGVMTVGPLVAFGLLILPPLAALPWARGMMSWSLAASATGGACGMAGFYIAYLYDLPLGPVIVCAAFAALAASQAVAWARRLAARSKSH